MKRIILVLAFIGMIMLQSCTTTTNTAPVVDHDTISEVFEYNQNVNFTSNNGFSVLLTYPHAIYTSDMVLLYRLSGVTAQGVDVWKQVPETFFFNDGTLNFRYDFNFTRFDTQVYMDGYDLASVTPAFRLNQVFRVVIVPAYFGKTNKTNFNDYDALVKVLGIDESKIIKM
jgi:hypothetical protein